jgi:hypothetical protein
VASLLASAVDLASLAIAFIPGPVGIEALLVVCVIVSKSIVSLLSPGIVFADEV